MSNGRRQACFSYEGHSSAHSMLRRQTSAPKRRAQTDFSPSPTYISAKEKATGGQDIGSSTLPVHKRCAWHVDNHVDERPIPCRTTTPHTLPNGRQHNPCNFTEMHFFAETRIGGQHRSYAICSLFYGRALRSLRTDRAELGWQDIMNG